jgi:hypothetical protein
MLKADVEAWLTWLTWLTGVDVVTAINEEKCLAALAPRQKVPRLSCESLTTIDLYFSYREV